LNSPTAFCSWLKAMNWILESSARRMSRPASGGRIAPTSSTMRPLPSLMSERRPGWPWSSS